MEKWRNALIYHKMKKNHAMIGLMRFLAAFLICSPALFLPYRARVLYGEILAELAHGPFILFGRLARFLLKQLGVKGFYGGTSRDSQ